MSARLLSVFCILVASVLLTVSASPQQRPARIALLIANANYPDANTPLSSAIRDARTLADEFRRSEFEIDLKENLSKGDMRAAIDTFTEKIRPGMSALVYFN